MRSNSVNFTTPTSERDHYWSALWMCMNLTNGGTAGGKAMPQLLGWALSGVTKLIVKCIWCDQWLETGDRTFLDVIQRYNEDDCRHPPC